MRFRVHLLLLLAAVAAAATALLLAVGVPLLARRALDVERFVALALAGGAGIVAVGWVVVGRRVARMLDRLLAAAARLGASDGVPLLGGADDAGGGSLTRAALAFERTAAALAEERRRLADKVGELQASNAALTQAREELLRSERLATVGQLAAGIAHEIGNPLGAVTGYVELARARLEAGGERGGEAADYLARIADEARRIDAIVRDLLDFARPARLALGPVSLAAAVEGALRLARVQERFRDVEVDVAIPGDLPPVIADERRLAQVFLNLLLNAGDAVRGKGRVEIRAAAPAGDEVEVTVRDDGPGLAPEILPRLFDPFFTTKPPGQGTGLGLAVCHGIVESFGGRIDASNAPGGGALLRLRLRAARPAGAGEAPPPDPA